MHLNIINAHGRTATTRNNAAAVSQFQLRATPKAAAAAERRYRARRYRTPYSPAAQPKTSKQKTGVRSGEMYKSELSGFRAATRPEPPGPLRIESVGLRVVNRHPLSGRKKMLR